MSYAELGDAPSSPISPDSTSISQRRSLEVVRTRVQANLRRYSTEVTTGVQFVGAFPHLVAPPTHKVPRAADICVRCRLPGPSHAQGHICADGNNAIYAAPGVKASDVAVRECELLVRKNESGRVGVCYVDIEVTRVLVGGGAERAGLRIGDRIVRIDGHPMRSGCEVQRAFAEAKALCSVTVVRVAAADKPKSPKRAPPPPAGPSSTPPPPPPPQPPESEDPFGDFMAARMSCRSPAAP
eukprot:TRINITY_DN5671_c0_g1_i1.p1 TRINITY_DN5671_c0_g1~~TRINITY_DN5671_c0_g1_i1.p1  ORF type:complete len:259 (+),score=65.23 TRINITY_DN5671_c0_g1_i1:60-779(+)